MSHLETNVRFDPDALRRLRASAGLTRTQLAAVVGRSAYTVGQYERGSHRPSVTAMYLIAEVFGVEVDALLSGGGR